MDILRLQFDLQNKPEPLVKINEKPNDQILEKHTQLFSESLQKLLEDCDEPLEKTYYENTIDPIEYINSGEIVLFSNHVGRNKSIDESMMVEYFRAFPNFHWTKYSKLYRYIISQLTENEQRIIQSMQEGFLRQQEEKQRVTKSYRKFVNQFSLNAWISEIFTNWLDWSGTKLNKKRSIQKHQLVQSIWRFIAPILTGVGLWIALRFIVLLLEPYFQRKKHRIVNSMYRVM